MSAPVEIPKHLEGVLAKLARAEQHLRALDDQIKGYLDECHSKISVPIKIDPNLDTIRLYFEPLPEPDLEISMVIGDCIHNARSSLDHLWKRLSGQGNFPIFGDIDGPNNWNANKIARLAGVDSGAHAIIDRLQPCHYRKDSVLHPLTVLNKLSNLDKHQAIHLTKPHSTDMQFTFGTDSSGVATAVIRPDVVFHDNTEVVITGVPKGAVHHGMNVDVQGTVFVALKDSPDWARQPVQEILRRLLDFLQRGVVGPLAIFTK